MPQVSQRIQRTDAAVIDSLLQRYGGVRGLINLCPGSPAVLPACAALSAAARAADNREVSTYGDVLGWAPLRDRWMRTVMRDWDSDPAGVQFSWNCGLELMVTAGANQGFFNLVLALCDAGDEVLLLLPYYFSHYNALVMADVRPIVVPCDPDTLLPANIDAVRAAITPKTKAIVLVSPGNPSGVVAPKSLVQGLVDLCRQADVWLVIDEAYKELTFDSPHYSPVVLEGVIKMYTMSKIYGMAGWRVGALVYPKSLSSQLRKIQDTIPTHPSILSQIAAYHALADGITDIPQRVADFAAVRARFATALHEVYDRVGSKVLGKFVCGNGAFYFFIPTSTRATLLDVVNGESERRDPVDFLVQQANVLVTPGWAFGMPGHVRVSYGSVSIDQTAEAVAALISGLESLLIQ
jgi:aspartate/methionine/tyrosine aminotransferase